MATINTDRVPPQNIDAEMALLGGLMLTDENQLAMAQASGILEPDMFYRNKHRKIYSAILDLFDQNNPVDLLTVTAKLKAVGAEEEVGGVGYLDSLVDSCPTAANTAYYAQIIHSEWVRRRVIQATSEANSAAFDDTVDVESLLSSAERGILNIRNNGLLRGISPVRPILKEAFSHVRRLYEREESIIGLSTGFHDLDLLTAGFQESEYILVAARPGMGKSAFVQNLAQYVAVDNGVPVLIFSLETSEMHLVLRMLSATAFVPLQNIRTGFLKDVEWPRLATAASKINESPIFIDDSTNITVAEMRARCRRLMLDAEVGLIIVDYLQLIKPDVKPGNREQEITRISAGLKAMAREFRVPLVACSQLSRSCEAREDKRPKLHDLRESGSLEQDADVVIFLYRDSYYEKNNNNSAELIIGKQRDGPQGVVDLKFNAQCLSFRDVDHP